MRLFEYQLQTAQMLQFEFTGDEPAKIHIEVDIGQVLLTTVVAGREQQTVIPEGRSWISGTDLRTDIEKVTIQRDPNGGATEPTVTFDIGPDAGTPGASANITVNQVKQGAADDSGSAALTLGGTAEDALAANTSRRYLLIHNIDASEVLWMRIGADAAADRVGNIKINAGGSVVFEGTFIPTERISVIAATTGHNFTAIEA